jgi:DNA-binding NtrC family response regulator
MASINCGAIPATLVESVLFGHEKGAFTGATQSSKGIFEEADGGTVLLDEVGELSASAQAALLRVLESKKITRVGSSKEITVDVRIIAATNRDLEAMCEEERFRWDLYYRLNAMTLKVPPLRERPEEVGPLAELFMREANKANGCAISGIGAEAMRLLHHYPWPGNVRELRNAIERAVVIARGDGITAKDLPQRLRDVGERTTGPHPAVERTEKAEPPARGAPGPTHQMVPVTGDTLDYKQRMQRFEAQLILDALRRCNWNRGEASQMLNMPVRTLSHKINQHGIKKLGYGLDEDDEDGE